MTDNVTPPGTVRQSVLIRAALDLVSEDGENSEYDRALVELLSDVIPVAGLDDLDPYSKRACIARLIGARWEP